MTFMLEAVYAFHGDALLLHYGAADPHPTWLLIDGGARGTYSQYLAPRLQQLKEDWELDGPVPLQMVMVSHTDSDHISGVLDLFKQLKDSQSEQICTVAQLWHNSFDNVIGNDDQELVSKLITSPPGLDPSGLPDEETQAVISSVGQGRRLRQDAESLGMASNQPFVNASGKSGLIMADPASISQGQGMTFQVLAPNKALVAEYQREWNEYLEKKGIAEVEAAGFNDESAFNLASIVVLASQGGRRMLLTGDARGDFVINGLVEGGLMAEEARYPVRQPGQKKREWRAAIEQADQRDIEPLHVDLLKLPHHGSDRNVTPGFFRRVTADHYVVSGNGNHHNPDPGTLKMIAAARGNDEYTIHLTFTADQHQTEPNPKFAAALKEVHQWVTNDKPDNCTIVHRDSGDDVYSIFVELDPD